jgi:hypothetical protein
LREKIDKLTALISGTTENQALDELKRIEKLTSGMEGIGCVGFDEDGSAASERNLERHWVSTKRKLNRSYRQRDVYEGV